MPTKTTATQRSQTCPLIDASGDHPPPQSTITEQARLLRRCVCGEVEHSQALPRPCDDSQQRQGYLHAHWASVVYSVLLRRGSLTSSRLSVCEETQHGSLVIDAFIGAGTNGWASLRNITQKRWPSFNSTKTVADLGLVDSIPASWNGPG